MIMKLNVKKLRESKEAIIVSSKDELADVTPINWSQDVLDGNKRVVIS